VTALVLVVVLGGGGAYLALKGSKKPILHHVAALSVPGPSSVAAVGTTLALSAKLAPVESGNPFGVVVAPDGKAIFAASPTSLAVLVRGPGLTVTRQYAYQFAFATMPAKGMAMTSDGKYLLIAFGNGVQVLSVADAEEGLSDANVGTLTVPGVTGYIGAVEVALSPGNKFAFVTMQYKAEIAVFNLHKALTTGVFDSSDYVGTVPVGVQPVGMAVSPDGQWLYATSIAAGPGHGPRQGLVSVINIATAEHNPGPSAVVANALAGASPVRVVVSPDGNTVWVTARQSNYLLGFSAALLRSHSKHALIAKVQVGQTPIGEILVDNGTKMIVADTDTFNTSPSAHNLAVVDLTKALARKPALVGYIQGGGSQPREFALTPDGRFLIVSDNGSAQVQIINLSKLS
jgi:DNA-binding beta-propeller fold protein YncE